jgi:hypothetical protein
MYGQCLNITPRFGLLALLPALLNSKLNNENSPSLCQDCLREAITRLYNFRSETLEIRRIKCGLTTLYKLIHGYHDVHTDEFAILFQTVLLVVINIINIKKLQSTFKKSCYRPCSHRSKTAKIKRERERGRERDSGNSSSYEAYNTIA